VYVLRRKIGAADAFLPFAVLDMIFCVFDSLNTIDVKYGWEVLLSDEVIEHILMLI